MLNTDPDPRPYILSVGMVTPASSLSKASAKRLWNKRNKEAMNQLSSSPLIFLNTESKILYRSDYCLFSNIIIVTSQFNNNI